MAKEARIATKQEHAEAAVGTLDAAKLAANAGLDRKAEDIAVLDVRGLASYTDFLVVMSATSDRQVHAVADAVDEQLRKHGWRPLGVEGQASGNWILIDAGDVVVHVFREDARQFYDLDRLWADAKRVAVEDARPAAATLTN